jgi:hypothetical protein
VLEGGRGWAVGDEQGGGRRQQEESELETASPNTWRTVTGSRHRAIPSRWQREIFLGNASSYSPRLVKISLFPFF